MHKYKESFRSKQLSILFEKQTKKDKFHKKRALLFDTARRKTRICPTMSGRSDNKQVYDEFDANYDYYAVHNDVS